MNVGMIRDILISIILAGVLMLLLKLPWALSVVLGATFFFSIRATHKFHAKVEAENRDKVQDKSREKGGAKKK